MTTSDNGQFQFYSKINGHSHLAMSCLHHMLNYSQPHVWINESIMGDKNKWIYTPLDVHVVLSFQKLLLFSFFLYTMFYAYKSILEFLHVFFLCPNIVVLSTSISSIWSSNNHIAQSFNALIILKSLQTFTYICIWIYYLLYFHQINYKNISLKDLNFIVDEWKSIWTKHWSKPSIHNLEYDCWSI